MAELFPGGENGTPQDHTDAAILESLRNEDKLRSSLWYGAQIDPKKAASILDLSGKTDFSKPFIEENLDDILKKVQQEKLLQQEQIARERPRTASWIRDPYNAASIKEELDLYGKMEDAIRLAGHPYLAARSDEELRQEAKDEAEERGPIEQAEYERIAKGSGMRQGLLGEGVPEQYKGPARETLDETKKEIERQAYERKKAAEAFITKPGQVGFFESLTERISQNLLFAAPLAAGVVDAGRAIQIYEAAIADQSGKATKTQKALLYETARVAAAAEIRGKDVWGYLAGALESLPAFAGGMGLAAKVVEKGGEQVAGEVVKKGLKAFLKKALDKSLSAAIKAPIAVPGQFVATAAQLATPKGSLGIDADGRTVYKVDDASTNKPLYVAIPQAALSTWADVFSAEVVGLWQKANPSMTQELVKQSVMKSGLKEVSQFVAMGEISKAIKSAGGITSWDLPTPIKAIYDPEARKELAATAIVGYGLGAKGAIQNNLAVRAKADHVVALTRQMDDLTEKLQAHGASPAVIEKIIGHQTSDTEVEHTYIDADKWDALAKTQGVDPAEKFEKVMGNAIPYNQSRVTGRIQVGTAEYQARVSKEDREALRTSVTYQPNAMSVDEIAAEAKRTKESQQDAGALYQHDVALYKEAAGGQARQAPSTEQAVQDAQQRVERYQPGTVVEDAVGDRWKVEKDKGGVRIVRVDEAGNQVGAAVAVKEGEKYVNEGVQTVARSKVVSEPSAKDVAADKAVQEQSDLVHQIIKEQLVKAGQSEEDAALQADVYRAGFTRMAKESGVDLTTLFEAFGPKIVKTDMPTVAAEGERVFEQPTAASGEPKGRIIQDAENRFRIELLKNSDPSTFLHETGHLFLEMLKWGASQKGASEVLKKDFDLVLKHFGLEKDENFIKEHHEEFARTFEAYLREGKAPSAALRPAFQRFKAWLTTIYRNIKQALGIEAVSPELRGVFDRMLATQDEIDQAYYEMGEYPMLDPAHMKPEEAAKYIDVTHKARQASEEYLAAKLMRDLEQKKTRQYKEKLKEVSAEAAVSVDARREQVALAYLEKGTKPDGSPLEANEEPFKLDRKAIVDAYGKDALKALPRGVHGEDGMDPDTAAGLFGYANGGELLKALSDLKRNPLSPQEAAVRQRIAQIEEQIAELESQKEPIETEGKVATKEVLAGKAALEKKLAKAMREEERSKVADIKKQLQDIKDRGGIRPSVATKEIPKGYEATGSKAVGSDDLAQEMADDGILKDAYSDTLYKWLNEQVEYVKTSKERLKQIHEKAAKQAKENLSSAIEAIIENRAAQARLRETLEAAKQEARKAEGEIQGDRRQAAIDQIVEGRMKAEYPELLESPKISEEALKAIHNDDSLKRKLWELQWIAENHLPRLKEAVRAVTGGRKLPDLAGIKRYADGEVRGIPYRKLDLGIYQRAEKSAHAEAREAVLRGDWQKAFDAHFQEALNHALYKAGAEWKDQISTMQEYLKRFEDRRVLAEIGKAEGNYLHVIQGLMERFDFSPATGKELDRRASLRDYYDEQLALAKEGKASIPVIPPGLLKDTYKKHWKDMTPEEIEGVYRTIKTVEHQALFKNELRTGQEKAKLSALTAEIAATITANGGKKLVPPLNRSGSPWWSIKRAVRQMAAHVEAIPFILRRMDGKENGPLQRAINDRFNEAGVKEAEYGRRNIEFVKGFFDSYSKAELVEMFGKREHVPEINRDVSKIERIMVLMNMGTEGNYEAMKRGGDGRGPWSDDAVQAIIKPLEKRDWDNVQKWWDYLEAEHWPKIEALYKRLDGLAPDKVEARPIESPFGTYRGGYHPLKYNRQASHGAKGNITAEDLMTEALSGAGVWAGTRHGFTQKRNEHVQQPVRLDPDVIFEHLNEVSHDLAYHEAVLDVNRIVHSEPFKQAVWDYHGDVVWDEIRDYVRDVAVGSRQPQGAYARGMNWLSRGMSTSMLAFNFLQAATDISGITQGGKRVGAEWMAKAVGHFMGDAVRMEGVANWIEEVDPFMKLRSRTMLRDLSDVRAQVVGRSQVERMADWAIDKATLGTADLNDIQNSFYWMLTKVQGVQDKVTWLAQYMKTLHEAGFEMKDSGDAGFQKAHETAMKQAQQAVLDAFGGGQVKDMPAIMRGGPLKSLFFKFYSFANRTLSNTVDSFSRAGREGLTISSVGRLAGDLMMLYGTPVLYTFIAQELLQGHGDKDREKRLMQSAASYILNVVPYLRELRSGVMGRDYQGPVGLRQTAVLNRIASRAMHGGWAWKDLNELTGSLFHYPALQLQRFADGMSALHDGGTSNPVAPLFGYSKR